MKRNDHTRGQLDARDLEIVSGGIVEGPRRPEIPQPRPPRDPFPDPVPKPQEPEPPTPQ